MELTKEQIQQIENYLDFKDLKHIDVRFEVLDHMISDIETSIQEQNTSFAVAFKNTKIKWKKQLEYHSNWLTGLVFTAPRLVIKKATQSYKKWFILMMILCTISIFFINKLKALDNYNNSYKWIATFLIIISTIEISIRYYKMKKDNLKTTYFFLFEKQVFYSSIFILTYILTFIFLDSSLSYYFLPGQLLLNFLGINLYKKHKKSVKRYKLS